MEEKPDWSNDEKDQLESQILMANEPTLCLDPDNSICERVTQIHNQRYMWNTNKFRRMARKFSQVTVNRKRKLEQFTYCPGLELFDFINKSPTESKSAPSHTVTSKYVKKTQEDLKPVPVPNLDAPLLSPLTESVVINQFKTYQPPKETNDFLPQLIEEYVLETDMPSKEKGKPRIYHIKLSILQRPSNLEYLGELYLDRDYKKDEQNGVACRYFRKQMRQYKRDFFVKFFFALLHIFEGFEVFMSLCSSVTNASTNMNKFLLSFLAFGSRL